MHLSGFYASLLILCATATLSGCNATTLDARDDASGLPRIETAQDERSPLPRKPARSGMSGDADVDPAQQAAGADVQAPQAASLGEAVSRPTSIKAGRTSIFSEAADDIDSPDLLQSIPRGQNGSVLASSAYSRMPGINPLARSVYGTATSGAPQ